MVNSPQTTTEYSLSSAFLACALIVVSLAIQAIWLISPARAADPVPDAQSLAESSPSESNNQPQRGRVDPQAEQRALDLVHSHLPELTKLLQQLRSDNPRQYELAIRDLTKSSRRLEFAKNRDEELYQIEVDLLKIQSSLKIHTAKLKVRDNQADRQALRQAAQRLLEVEIARAKYNVRICSERVQRADQQLAAADERLKKLQQDGQPQLKRKIASLLRTAGRQANKTPDSNSNLERSKTKRRQPTPTDSTQRLVPGDHSTM